MKMGLIILFILGCAAVAFVLYGKFRATYYTGAVTDHFDGREFINHGGNIIHTRSDLLKWRLENNRQTWPEWVEIKQQPKPASRVDGSELRATFINHSTVLVQTQGLNILTDPIWSKRASPFTFVGPKRAHDPGISFDDLPKIDVVLISHNHYDHMDIPTLKRLWDRDKPHIILPLGNDVILKRAHADIQAIVTDWNDITRINDVVRVITLPVYHWSARTPFDRNRALWASYMIEIKGSDPIYFAGDTGYRDGQIFKDIGKKYDSVRLAMIPIGAYEPRWFMAPSHVNVEEAVQIHHDINAKHSIGVHYGTFQLTDEAIDSPAQTLEKIRDKNPDLDFQALLPGEFINIP